MLWATGKRVVIVLRAAKRDAIVIQAEPSTAFYMKCYIGKLATDPGLVVFMHEQLDKPIPSHAVENSPEFNDQQGR